jgi:23S rRNA pseudouridine1911/1915/1917 synthase
MESFRQQLFPMDHRVVRLDSFLVESLPDVSRSQLKKLIEAEQVLLDGHPAKAGVKLKGGEQIAITLPEPAPIDALPEALPLTILYEDKYLIVIDKAAGMVVHPAAGHACGTLVNALLHHCTDLAGIGGGLRPGIVHRIDKDTSGVMVVTKDDQSHQFLAAQFKQHSVNRRYLALVHGLMKDSVGSIDQPLGRHPVQRKKISSNTRHGKRAVTHWKVLKRYDVDHLTLVELALETGRTHQIRVHLSEMAHPLVADPLYTNSIRKKNLVDGQLRQLIEVLPGQALHARDLGFVHPDSLEQMEFRSELPCAFMAIIDYLDLKYSVAGSLAQKQS